MLRESTEWNEKQKQQVSHLNIELVHALRNTDTAFTLGKIRVYAYLIFCAGFVDLQAKATKIFPA